MHKLLSAGFSRLWKNRFFWFGITLLPGFMAIVLVNNYCDMKKNSLSFPIDGYLYGCFLFMGMFTSIFAAQFLGTEYSDGTVRNKLAVGHSRTAVYLSSLTVCFVSSLLVCLAAIFITFALGIPLFGTPSTPLPVMIQNYAHGILMIAALSGLFTLLAMMITSKPVSATVCTTCFFILLFVSAHIMQRLTAPEMITGGYDLAANGSVVPLDPYPNPRYLTGTVRKVYELIQYLLPTGTGMHLAQFGCIEKPLPAVLCSLFVAAVTTVGGVFAFRKKDLK